MIQVDVKYFASMREKMGCSEQQLQLDDDITVLNLWENHLSDQPLPVNTLMAVNHEYVNNSHLLRDGDEVAFFPPVTGG